jgi:hypothetical protein
VGRFDAGCILATADRPVVQEDRIVMYYTGINTTHGGPLPPKEIAIGRATWRLDGFVSLDAGESGGLLETVALSTEGGARLLLNANAEGGEFRAEVLDRGGQPVEGYRSEDCQPVRTDSVRHHVRWKERAALPAMEGFKFRFQLRSTQLFSFALAAE